MSFEKRSTVSLPSSEMCPSHSFAYKVTPLEGLLFHIPALSATRLVSASLCVFLFHGIKVYNKIEYWTWSNQHESCLVKTYLILFICCISLKPVGWSLLRDIWGSEGLNDRQISKYIKARTRTWVSLLLQSSIVTYRPHECRKGFMKEAGCWWWGGFPVKGEMSLSHCWSHGICCLLAGLEVWLWVVGTSANCVLVWELPRKAQHWLKQCLYSHREERARPAPIVGVSPHRPVGASQQQT